jgi:primosomal protein N'
MKIQSITSQHRRDFTAVYLCEDCGHSHKASGYDDDYFHNEVVPQMKCKACGKSTLDLGIQPSPLTPRYPAHAVV